MTLPTVQLPENADQQVFVSVPTRDDMRALSGELDNVRRTRSRLLLAAIFLAGVVVAAAAAVGLIYSNSRAQIEAANAQLESQAATLKSKDATIAKRDATIAEQRALLDGYADFQSIVVLQQQADKLELEIASLLMEPSRANAPKRLSELPAEVQWIDGVITALRNRREALAAKKTAIEFWPPVPQSPKPD